MAIGSTILGFVSEIFKPAAKLIDDLHTSEEEKAKIQLEMSRIQTDTALRVLEYESKLLQARADIVKADAQSQHWLQANWRPITMLTFVGLVCLRFFGLNPEGMTETDYANLWSLIQIGLGGYVVGRSAEKVMRVYKEK
jgi:hypothetical protein